MVARPNIQTTQGFGKNLGVKIIVYGDAGVGKTVLCSTAPSPIILSAESGLLSLASMNLPYIEINTIDDLRKAYQWFKNSQEPRNMFQTICMDSVSEIAETCLANYKKVSKDPRQAYGAMIDEISAIIREFRDLRGYNVYMSAKMERIKNEATGFILNGPSMPGNKMGQAVPYFPDEVFRLDIDGIAPNTYRLLRTQPDMINIAKDRSGKLDPIEEPHLGKIIAKILA